MAKGGTYPVSVDLPEASELGYFTLDSARASTHVSSDPEQAMFNVPFSTAPDGAVTITVPDELKLLPGWYKLTAVTTARVPSESLWVQVT